MDETGAKRVFCTICESALVNRGHLSSLPCGHVFHEQCINQWLDVKCECPIDRKRIDRRMVKRLYLNEKDYDLSSDDEDQAGEQRRRYQ